MNLSMRSIKFSVSVAMSIVFCLSCDSDDDAKSVHFFGTVDYVRTGLPAVGIPVELRLYESMPINTNIDNNGIYFTTVTDADGKYAFDISFQDVPTNPHFIIFTKADTLVNLPGGVRPGVLGSWCGFFYNYPLPLNSTNQERNMFVDYPTFLQITFDKLDHESTGFIRYAKDCRLTLETSSTQPDTTILEMLPYTLTKDSHTSTYYLSNEYSLDSLFTIKDVQWKKGDTTKITIEY